MRIGMIIAALAFVLTCSVIAAAQKPDFSGSWVMDRARSFGLPGNMNQTMVVTQTGDEITLETKLIQPGNERTQKDSYVLDGKERDFTPPPPPNASANAPAPKGKRTATWMPGNKGILVTDVVTTESPKGPVTSQTVRKWTLTNGELVIAMFIDNPNASFEAKRIFKKNK